MHRVRDLIPDNEEWRAQVGTAVRGGTSPDRYGRESVEPARRPRIACQRDRRERDRSAPEHLIKGMALKSESHDPRKVGVNGRMRGRGLGLAFPGVTGPANAITDVPGVRVGYSTIVEDTAGASVRTGVTAVLPRPHGDLLHPVWAGTFSLNGNGELTGCHWIREAGWFAGPITLTNTCSLGIAHHAAVRWLIRNFPSKIGESEWPLPVVGETFDGWLNDIAGLHVQEHHVLAAIDGATSGPVAEGSVGGGTGMIAYEFKAGSGTSSRIVGTEAGTFTVGAFVQANHGLRPWLRVCGVPVGEALQDDRLWDAEKGSIIAIIATDAPLAPHQLARVARRISLGLGRGGTPSSNNSGDIFIAFSTANDPGEIPECSEFDMKILGNPQLDPIFMATVDSVEEAILNAILAAEPMIGRYGRNVPAIDHDELMKLVRSEQGNKQN